MKTKILSIIIAIIAICTVFTVAYAEKVPDSIEAVSEEYSESASDEVVDGAIEFIESNFGDVNEDGKRNAADARLLLRVSAQLDNVSVYILTYGDYNMDNQITASDARTALRVSAMLENIECILHGHDMAEKIIEPTCTKDGYTTNKCTRCAYSDNSITNKTNAIGHVFTLIKTVPATCTIKGYDEYECVICGITEYRNETDIKSHNMVASKTVNATCTTSGYTEYKCSVCGAVEKRDITKAGGHNYQYVSKENINAYFTKATKKCSYCKNVIETYEERGSNIQVPATIIHSKEAYAINEKYDTAYHLEGYDITGKKLVVYGMVDGLDNDGYYYWLDGTLKGTHDVCGKPYGEGTGMCDGYCNMIWGDTNSGSS